MLATYHVALGADHALASGDFGGVIGLLGPSIAFLVDGEFLDVGGKNVAVALALFASVGGMGLGGGPASDYVALAVFASVVGLAMASVVGLAAAGSAGLAAAGLAAGGHHLCCKANGGALAPWSHGTPGSASSSSDSGVTSVVTGVAVASVVGLGVGASVVDLAVGSFVAALALSVWATLQGGGIAWGGSKPGAGITAGASAVLEPGSKVFGGEAGVGGVLLWKMAKLVLVWQLLVLLTLGLGAKWLEMKLVLVVLLLGKVAKLLLV